MNTQKAWLAYLVGWITGLIFFLTEKDDKFVKFHGMQSIFLSIALVVISFVLGLIPIVGWIISMLFGLFAWIFSMVKAGKGEWFKWPLIGDWAMNVVEK